MLSGAVVDLQSVSLQSVGSRKLKGDDVSIIGERLRNQKLIGAGGKTAAGIVSWLGAVQSQDYPGAKWAIGLRSALSDADVERAFNAGEIVRTHILRPTWHFVAPRDLRWMQRLAAPRVKAGNRHYCRRSGLDDATLAKGRRVIERALSRSGCLTRTALGAALAKAGIEGGGQRLAYLVMDAELELVVCSGPLHGKQITYALVDERVPKGDLYVGDEALAELARRYFTSHGPATVHDFSWWSGLTVTQCRLAVDAVGTGLTSRVVDEITYWSASAPTRATASPTPTVHLLPNYDEYLNALRDRSLAFDHKGPVVTLSMFMGFPHQLVIDGVLRGAWRRVTGRTSTDIGVRPFRPLSRRETAATAAAVERFGRFLNAPTTLSLA